MSVGLWPFWLTGKFSARPQSETRLPATDSSSARSNERKPNGWRMPLTLAADASRGQSEGLFIWGCDKHAHLRRRLGGPLGCTEHVAPILHPHPAHVRG